MRILTIVAGLFLAVIFSLDGSLSQDSTNVVREYSKPSASASASAASEKHDSVDKNSDSPTPTTSANEAKADSKPLPSVAAEVRADNYRNSSLPSTSGRSHNDGADYLSDGKDLWKEFFNSLYVDRYGRGVKTQTALSALNVGNLAVLGIVVLGGLALVAPLIFPEPYKRSMGGFLPYLMEERQLQKFITSGLVGVSESIMGWVEKSVDDLPSFPRLDAQECMKRSICEAHNQPKKYGAVGLFLQLFFPPYTETEEPSRIVSKYQLAARYGRQETANCAAQYDGCMVNFLDAVQGIINLVF